MRKLWFFTGSCILVVCLGMITWGNIVNADPVISNGETNTVSSSNMDSARASLYSQMQASVRAAESRRAQAESYASYQASVASAAASMSASQASSISRYQSSIAAKQASTEAENARLASSASSALEQQREQQLQSSESSTEATTSTAESSSTISQSELLDYARDSANAYLAQVQSDLNGAVIYNDNKGASKLKDAYLLRVKEIKTSKITMAQRLSFVQSQITALQQALSSQLNDLQLTHTQTVNDITQKVAALSDSHSSDSKAIALHDKLVHADYVFSQSQTKAYLRFNKAVTELEEKQTVAKTRRQQLEQAKSAYLGNLEAVRAIDPDDLEKSNQTKLAKAKEKAKNVIALVKDGTLVSKSDIDEYFE